MEIYGQPRLPITFVDMSHVQTPNNNSPSSLLQTTNTQQTSIKNTFKMDPKAYQLITFAANGDLENLKKLLKENPKLDINSCDYDGRTALHLSAEEGI